MPFTCPSCGYTSVRQADLVQHLEKATAPGCIQAGSDLRLSIRRPVRHDRPRSSSYHTRRSSSPPQSSSAAPPSDTEGLIPEDVEQAGDFEGDFFGMPGDYQNEDFPFDPSEPEDQPEDAPRMESGPDAARMVAEEDDNDEEDDEGEEAVGRDALEEQGEEGPSPSGAAQSEGSHRMRTLPLPPLSPHHRSREPSAEPPDEDMHNHPPPGPGGVQPEDHEHLRAPPVYVRKFKGRAGEALSEPAIKLSAYADYARQVPGSIDNPYAPFTSQLDWELAQWAKLRGPSSTAFSDLLKIPSIVEVLGLSYKNTNELNTIIDDSLPLRRPAFRRHDASVMGEKFDVFARDILECIAALISDAEHVRYLVFAPERHYADADNTIRLYHDLHTGKWWWDTQVSSRKNRSFCTILTFS
ncbi:hypothetical protein C8T65DRAFT_596952 [Cerioporus squamosus]|nr:hypothetical protein C8T65DRAFT_596952 [Cerioporus squamosus]